MIRSIVWAIFLAGGWSLIARADDKPPANFDPAKALAEMQQQFMQRFDMNHDGKLDAQENLLAQEAMRREGWNLGIAPGGSPLMDQFSKQFDADHDGRLNPTEAMMAQMAFQRMLNHRNGAAGRGGIRGGIGGGGGSALPQQPVMPIAPAAGDQKASKVPPLVKRFDKDGDGKLNADEKAAAQAERKKDKAKDKEKDAKPKEKAKK